MFKNKKNVSDTEQKNQIINHIHKILAKNYPDLPNNLIYNFITCFYANTTQEDLNNLSQTQVSSIIKYLWEFFVKKDNNDIAFHITKNVAGNIIISILLPNMSFILDSFYMLINKLELSVLITLHPVIKVKRDPNGQATKISLPNNVINQKNLEALVYCEIADNKNNLEVLQAKIKELFYNIQQVNQDWYAMRANIMHVTKQLIKIPANAKISEDEKKEIINFLNWVENSHFTFLGYCNYDFSPNDKKSNIDIKSRPESALGILKNDKKAKLSHLFQGVSLKTKEVKYLLDKSPLIINKTSVLSTVHRNTPMDCVGIKQFNDAGEVTGAHLFLGLFTSMAYATSATNIPMLRNKVKKVIELAGFKHNWHDGRALSHILDFLPRDELLQSSIQELKKIGLDILKIRQQARIALFVRRDEFNRFFSCLIYIPRERFEVSLCEKIEKLLEQEFKGKVDNYKAQFGSLDFARVSYTVSPYNKNKQNYNVLAIEEKLIHATNDWADLLKKQLSRKVKNPNSLFKRYQNAFDKSYKEHYNGQSVVDDIITIETFINERNLTNKLNIRIHNDDGFRQSFLKLKIYNLNSPLPLSDIIPIIENTGMKVVSEVPFKVSIKELDLDIWIHDFYLDPWNVSNLDINITNDNITETLIRAYSHEIENDNFNRLVTKADLDYRHCNIFRAYAKYIRLAGLPFSRVYISETLEKNPKIAKALIELFKTRFAKTNNDKQQEKLIQKIEEIRHDITAADEDRVIDLYLQVILATVRTNFYQQNNDNQYKNYVSFKISSRDLDFLPNPKPLYEIFIYSSFMEAIHLRGGKIARGGIRWSERPEDYRTEILGLQKAQTVKNSLIVPVGAKGGFVIKNQNINQTREDIAQMGVQCYQTMIKGMLDITDNLIDGKVIHPQQVIIHDSEDPYLVVAADKGTASFSDFGNQIAQKYKFWLGDAFASGGSEGYDHKKMGITARGAWEAVKRHFLEKGQDIQKEEFDVVGIGDMSGDIFGNGMLLSTKIRLIAAFNHNHIFIDPHPDIKKTYQERKRLFNKKFSSWENFNSNFISKGGGVFSRKVKKIKLSPEIAELFTLTNTKISPNDLIKIILHHKTDLLWLAGIGTYVKASTESHHEVGDRNNDNIRVNAKDLGACVVGEGANLGCTQLARVEFEQVRNGYINTDAIDNSAGVSCSDREVNIKILFNNLMRDKKITLAERNACLTKMTAEVTQMILRDNILQPLAINIMKYLEPVSFYQLIRLTSHLEQEEFLDRQIEFLPDERTLTQRQSYQSYFTRAEIGVLLGYSKIYNYEKILVSNIANDDYFQRHLKAYFPQILQEKYPDYIAKHPLKNEITSTYIINEILHRMGASFIQEAMRITDTPIERVVHAFFVVVYVLELNDLWQIIEKSDSKIAECNKNKVLIDIHKINLRMILWIISNYPISQKINDTIKHINSGIQLFIKTVNNSLDEASKKDLNDKLHYYLELGFKHSYAKKLSLLNIISYSPDIILIAEENNISLEKVATLYFKIGRIFYFNKLQDIISAQHSFASSWERSLVHSLSDDLINYQGDLTSNLLHYIKSNNYNLINNLDSILAKWRNNYQRNIQNIESLINESLLSDNFNLSVLSIIIREIKQLSGY